MAPTPPPIIGLENAVSVLKADLEVQSNAIQTLDSKLGAKIQQLQDKINRLRSREPHKKRKRALAEEPHTSVLSAIQALGSNLEDQLQKLEAKIDELVDMPADSVSDAYNRRALLYDKTSTFHWRLALEYVEYVKPKAGESLLDLACGTGLVTFTLAHYLQGHEDDRKSGKAKIIGVDISSGMLDQARSKLNQQESAGFEIEFVEHDIMKLDEVEELRGMEGGFDIITVCSALVLLDDPAKAIKHWTTYLKPGGRLVLDVPHPSAMLGVKVLSKVAKEFRIPMLGNREWIKDMKSLKKVLEDAGLDANVVQTKSWDDVPARTKYRENYGRGEEGIWYSEDSGYAVFDLMTKDSKAWAALGSREREDARDSFDWEWRPLDGVEGDEGFVKEVNRLFIGVGMKP